MTGPGGKMAPSPWGHLLKTCLMNFWKGRGRDPNKAQRKLNPAIRQHLEGMVWGWGRGKVYLLLTCGFRAVCRLVLAPNDIPHIRVYAGLLLDPKSPVEEETGTEIKRGMQESC